MHRIARALALLFLLAAAAPAGAQGPYRRWRTLETPHFVLHFHEGLYEVALRAARGLEDAHERLVPLLGAEPTRKTQVLLADDTDDANGSATAAIRPRITLRAVPPDDLSVLNDHDDYLRFLVTHEYVHVLHLGTVHGLPAAVNTVLGDVLVPNGWQPNFVTEGLATHIETAWSASGRGRSALFDMILRAQVLEGRMLDLGDVAGGAGRWPRGTAAYLYGGRFVEHLASTRGEEALARYSHRYGSSVVPYGLNLALADAADVDFVTAWKEWRLVLETRYQAQAAAIRAQGPVTEPERRTRFGERTGQPRFGPDGALYYLESGPDRRPRVRRLDPETGADVELAEVGGDGELAVLPDGAVLLSRPETVLAVARYGDLFRVDERGETRLTVGLRASELDVSRDGAVVLFVQRGPGRTRIGRLRLDQPAAAPEVVYEPPPEREVFTPRLSPDGRRVAFTEKRRGPGRDLLVGTIGPDGTLGEVRRLTDDPALDLDPAWSADGATLYFASDRTGVYNVYEVPAAGGAVVRLTNVLTGALSPWPSPDGTWLAYQTCGADGFDVAAVRFASLVRADAEDLVDDRPRPLPELDRSIGAVRPYDPLETLAPLHWFPWFTYDAYGPVLGALTSGEDVVGLHGWALSAGAGLGSSQPSATGQYRYRGWFPDLDAGASTGLRAVPGFPAGTVERWSGANVGLSFPWSDAWHASQLRVGAELVSLDGFEAPGPTRPRPGLVTELTLSLGLAHLESPVEAISPEQGYSLSVEPRFASTELGGDFSYGAVSATAAGYLRVPPLRHHVLAAIARAAAGSGDLGSRRLFRLGGPQLRDPVLDLLYAGAVLSSQTLRGYDPDAFSGQRLVLGTLEYRFPLADLETGPFTLPIWVGKLHAAAFAEAGDAGGPISLEGLHPSAGLELRLDLAAGIAAGQLRGGWAYGFDRFEGGGPHAYLGIGGSL